MSGKPCRRLQCLQAAVPSSAAVAPSAAPQQRCWLHVLHTTSCYLASMLVA